MFGLGISEIIVIVLAIAVLFFLYKGSKKDKPQVTEIRNSKT
jgi:hypothetical protein